MHLICSFSHLQSENLQVCLHGNDCLLPVSQQQQSFEYQIWSLDKMHLPTKLSSICFHVWDMWFFLPDRVQTRCWHVEGSLMRCSKTAARNVSSPLAPTSNDEDRARVPAKVTRKRYIFPRPSVLSVLSTPLPEVTEDTIASSADYALSSQKKTNLQDQWQYQRCSLEYVHIVCSMSI